jgi:hypothetical protein
MPDVQLLVSRNLGDGSTALCDKAPPLIGGVPATVPLTFGEQPEVVAATNDLGCRVNDGAGSPLGRNEVFACTRSDRGFLGYGFVDSSSTVQFCLPIASLWAFPDGDTVVAVRVRDVAGNVGPVREVVVRIDRDGPDD